MWCCITTAGSGSPSTEAKAACTSTAYECPRCSSMTAGRSLSAIRSTGRGWYFRLAPPHLRHRRHLRHPRHPRHRELRRVPRCGPSRRPPLHIADPVHQDGRRSLNLHLGRSGRNDRRFRPPPPCRRWRQHLIASTRHHPPPTFPGRLQARVPGQTNRRRPRLPGRRNRNRRHKLSRHLRQPGRRRRPSGKCSSVR
jgi:hypothetical protein